MESVDLNDATREVIALSLSQLQRNRVIVRTELAEDLPTVNGDRVQLQQVVLNLLRNASDAMSAIDDRPRQLLIRTERDDGHRLRLSVQDTAPASILERWTGCSTPSTRRSRTEWESPRCQSLDHRAPSWPPLGNIERWSRRGRYPSPFLSIPTACQMTTALRHSDGCCGECATGHEERMSLTRFLVSVVDDDESVRESLPDLLKEFGFAVQAFSSAEEFLAFRLRRSNNCLILDIAMPGMTGPDLQRELRFRRKEIRVVFITAHRDESVRPRMLELGGVECL